MKKIRLILIGVLIIVIISYLISLLNDERDSIFVPGHQVPEREMLSLLPCSGRDLQLIRAHSDSISCPGSGELRPEMIALYIQAMKFIYVFELQCCVISQENRNLIHYYHEKEIDVCDYTYGAALFLAKRIFRKLNPACKRVPPEQIQVLNFIITDPEDDYTFISKGLQQHKHKELQQAMDEILAEYLRLNPRRVSKTITVVELMNWLQEKRQQNIDFKNIDNT